MDPRIDEHKLLYHPEVVADWVRGQGTWAGIRQIYPLYVEISPFGGVRA